MYRKKMIIVVLSAVIVLAGCKKEPAAETQIGAGKTESKPQLSDAPLEQYRRKLLETAYKAAISINPKPHIKDLCRAQQSVVEAMIELEQIKTAAECAAQVSNWRRGVCYAELADYFAEKQDIDTAEKYLSFVGEVLNNKDDEDLQTWRSDRLKVLMAEVETVLVGGKSKQEAENEFVESETGKIAAAQALYCDEQELEKQIAMIDAMVSTGVFDVVNNCLVAYSNLYSRFYSDEQVRVKLEEKIIMAWAKSPFFIRVDILEKMTDAAIEQGDTETSDKLLEMAVKMVNTAQWPVNNRMPATAKVAKMLYRAGKTEQALAELDREMEAFNEGKQLIIDMYRSEALCPVAESYKYIGSEQKALEVFKLAADEGALNKNPRPRAEDLSMLCCVLAKSAIQPDEELAAKIQKVLDGLDSAELTARNN
jgi:tetratricopeptide (TPR) repeat protein